MSIPSISHWFVGVAVAVEPSSSFVVRLVITDFLLVTVMINTRFQINPTYTIHSNWKSFPISIPISNLLNSSQKYSYYKKKYEMRTAMCTHFIHNSNEFLFGYNLADSNLLGPSFWNVVNTHIFFIAILSAMCHRWRQ